MATFRVRNAANNGWLDLADVQGFRVRNAANNGWLDINGGDAILRVRNAANDNWIEYTPVQEISSIETTSGFTTLLDVSGNANHQGGGGTGLRSYGLWLDGPLNVYRGGDGHTYVITCHSETYRFRVGNWTNGASWSNLTNVYNSDRQVTEGVYNCRDWIFGCYAIGNTVYGIAHHEWYRNTVSSNGIGGYPVNTPEMAIKQHTRAIKWFKSTNNGASWSIKPTANASRLMLVPEPWNTQQKDTIYGWLHPSNVVKEGSHYYCFVQAYNLKAGTNNLETGFSLIRTTNLENTTGWQFWNGSGWTTRNNGYQGNLSGQQPYIFFQTNNYNPYTNSPAGHKHRVAQCVRYHVPTQQWLIFGYRGDQSPYFCYGRSQTLANPQFEVNGLQTIALSGGGSQSDYIGNRYLNVFDPNDTDQNFQNILGDTALVVAIENLSRYRRQTIRINVS